MASVDDDARAVLAAHLSDVYDELERLNAVLTGTATAMQLGQGHEGDGYRIANAIADLRRLARDEADTWGETLRRDVEPNAAMHLIGLRTLWCVLEARATILFAEYPGGDVKPIRTAVNDLLAVRKDIEALLPVRRAD